MSLFSRTDKSLLGRWWWTVDRGMLALILSIIAYGVVLVAAASPPVAERIGAGEYHFIIRHLILLAPALVILFGMSLCDKQMIWRAALCVLGGGLVAMVLVLAIGPEVKGATRWLPIFGFSLQPSEFVKPAFVVVAAWLIAREKEVPTFAGQKWALGLFALVISLLLMQPDLGMSIVVSGCFLGLIFLAGLRLRLVALLLGVALGALIMAYFSFSHVQSRIDRFMDPSSGDTYQVEQSLEAFKNGGVFGTGAGQGTVKLNIPDAHADFIFSVAGEELGMMFVLLMVLLYGGVIVRGFNRVMDSDDLFAVLATGGLLIMFGGQALIHMGSALSLLPTKGMTLPFISYGGSSLLAMAMSMGFVLALTRKQANRGIARGSLSLKPTPNSVKAYS
ncbi:MAG: putative peptidoglycan glycosyltransferase FtsW [Pseudomonadota bacterium]